MTRCHRLLLVTSFLPLVLAVGAGPAHAQDVNLGSWVSGPDYPGPVHEHSCVTSNGRVYCVGGRTQFQWCGADIPFCWNSEFDLSFHAPLADTAVGAWSETTKYPVAIQSHSCVAHNNRIYCVGGLAGTPGEAAPTRAVLHAALTPSGIGEWKSTTAYTIPSGAEFFAGLKYGTDFFGGNAPEMHSCVADNGYIYCVGGLATFSAPGIEAKPSVPSGVVLYAELKPDGVGEWKAAGGYGGGGVAGHSCVASNGYIYCVGGYMNKTWWDLLLNPLPKYTSEVWYAKLNGAAGVGPWRRTTSYLGGPRWRLGCAVNGETLVCGGGGSDRTYAARIGPSGVGPWQFLGSYPSVSDWEGASCVSHNGTVHCVGGHEAGLLSDVGLVRRVASAAPLIRATMWNALEGESRTGELATLSVPPGTPVTNLRVNWGDGSPVETGQSLQLESTGAGRYRVVGTHTHRDNLPLLFGFFTLPYVVEVCADVGIRTLCANSFAVVANVPPAIALAGDLPREFQSGGEPNLIDVTLGPLATFDDPGADTFTASVDWSDGTVGTFPITRGAMVGNVSHRYDLRGKQFFEIPAFVKLCIKDDDGGQACTTTPLNLRPANLTVAKSAATLECDECSTYTYDVSVWNTLGFDVHDVQIVDRLSTDAGQRASLAYVNAVALGAGGAEATDITHDPLGRLRHMGQSIAMQGRTAVVVTSGDAASSRRVVAHVYERNTQGMGWTLVRELLDDRGSRSYLESSVDIDGDTIVIGFAGLSDSGVLVFERRDGTWGESPALSMPSIEPAFGWSVAISGSWMAIGSPVGDSQGFHGVVRTYRRDEIGAWRADAVLTIADHPGWYQPRFGHSVAIEGDTLAVGAPEAFSEAGNPIRPGAVFVYRRQGDAWMPEATLRSGAGLIDHALGASVALSGPVLLAGAPADDDFRGAAFAFERTPDGWSTPAKLTPVARLAGAFAGLRVAVSGDMAVIAGGRVGIDTGGLDTTDDQAHAFVRTDAGIWQRHTTLTAPPVPSADPTGKLRFGHGLAVDQGRILVGAPLAHPVEGSPRARGAVYTFEACAEIGDGRLRCSVPTLREGEIRTFRITVFAGGGLAPPGESTIIRSDVTVSGAAFEDSFEDNTAFIDYTVTDRFVNCHDVTPPIITPQVTGTRGLNEWFVSDVAVSWTVSDPQSGVGFTSCMAQTIGFDVVQHRVSCLAVSPGGESHGEVVINRDATKPAIAAVATAAAGGAAYNLAFSCSDNLSGVAGCPANTTVVPGASLVVQAADNAGNVRQVTLTVPRADAGMDAIYEVEENCLAPVVFDASGSFDASGPIAAWRWNIPGHGTIHGETVTAALPIGTHTITLSVTNTAGVTVTDVVVVVVQDTTPPFFTHVPGAIDADEEEAGGAAVAFDQAIALDSCGPVAISHDAPVRFAPGQTVVTFTATDAHGLTNQATTVVNVVPRTDLRAAIELAEGSLYAGVASTILIRVHNHGPSPATGAMLSLLVPSGFAFTDDGLPLSCAAAPDGALNCVLGALAVGDIELPITGTLPASARGPATVSISVSAASGKDPNITDNTASLTTAIIGRANLAIAVESGRALAGTPLDVTYHVTNAGPSNALGVALRHTLPAHTTFLSGDERCAPVGGMVECAIGTMATGTAAPIVLRFAVDGAARAQLAMTANVASDDMDPDLADNAVETAVPVDAEADLRASVVASRDPAVAGLPLDYTLTVANFGPSDAAGPEIVFEYEGSIGGGGIPGCQPEGAQRLRCAVGRLTAGAVAARAVDVHIGPTARAPIAAHVAVQGEEPDPDGANNHDTLVTGVIADVDVAVDLTPSLEPAIAGQGVSYALRLSSLGPSSALGVRASIALPDNATFEAASAACHVDGQSVWCDTGTLGPDSAATFHVQLAVSPFARGTLRAVAEVLTTDDDREPANQSAEAHTTISAEADVRITAAAAATAVAGSVLRYVIEVANDGPSAATGIVVTQPLGAAVTFSPPLSDVACGATAGMVTCAVPDLAPGATRALTIATMPATAATLAVTTTAAAAEADPDAANNTVTTSTNVSGPAAGRAGSGDFDGDGDVDLAAVDRERDLIAIFDNDGAGRFVERMRIATGRMPVAIAAGDYDGDGDGDLAVVNRISNDVTLLVNDGSGGFVEAARVAAGGLRPTAVNAGDLDGDGHIDLAIALEAGGALALLLNDGAGVFRAPKLVQLHTGRGLAPEPAGLTVADLDGDGDLDVAVADRKSGGVIIVVNELGTFHVAGVVTGAGGATGIAAADVNGDGKLDLLVADEKGDRVLVVRAVVDGYAPWDAAHVGRRPAAIAAADLNSDGALDVVTVSPLDESITMLINGDDGSFPVALRADQDIDLKTSILVAGDLNGDGAVDLLVVSEHGLQVRVLLNGQGGAQ